MPRSIRIEKSLEYCAVTFETFRRIRKEILAFPDKTYVIREHGLNSIALLVFRLYAGLEIPSNVKYVLVSGPYSRDRLIEAGWPPDNIYIIGPHYYLPQLKVISAKNNTIAFLPYHEQNTANVVVPKLIGLSRLHKTHKIYAKTTRKHGMIIPGIRNSIDNNELATSRAVISAVPFQTIAAATIAAGIPTALYKRFKTDRWDGEQEYTDRYFASAFKWDLPFFENSQQLRDVFSHLCKGEKWSDMDKFRNEMVGLNVPRDAETIAIEKIRMREQ